MAARRRYADRVRSAIAGLAVLAVAAPAFVMSPNPALADAVRVTAAQQSDLGRIVFAWPAPVSYRSALAGRRLTVSFGRPIEAALETIPGRLGKYVAGIEPGADGKSVVLRLKGNFDAYAFDSGSAVIVEIADTPGSAAGAEPTPEPTPAPKPEPKPDAAAKADTAETAGPSKDLPSVRVRSGVHADYTRLVFDWPRRVPYTFDQKGGVATVTFGRAAAIDLSRLQSRPPPLIGGADAVVSGDTATVRFAVPASSRVRHFLAGPKVVLDVRRPSGDDKAEPLPAREATVAEVKAAEETDKAPAKTGEDAPVTGADQEPPPGPAKTAAAPPATPPATPPAAPATAAAQKVETAAASRAPAGGAQRVAAETPPAVQPPAAAAGAGPRALTPTPLTPRGQAPAASSPTAPATASPGAAPTPAATGPGAIPVVPAAVVKKPPSGPPADAVTLRFDWDAPVGAAVFRRAGYLWVAFDKPTAIDIDQLRSLGGNIIKGIEQLGTTRATVLRMSLIAGINPGIRRDGLAWLLDFSKQPLAPATALEVKAQPDSPIGARLFISVPEPGDPIAVTDPEVGDSLVIVPLLPLHHGVELAFDYPQMRFLPTAQGVVLQPRADDIRVRPLRQGIEITSGSELQISTVTAEAEANRQLVAQKPLTRILDLERWKVPELIDFVARKHDLLNALALSRGPQREAARLNLARFYFANAYGAEALSILSNVAKDRPEIEADPEFRMLRGGAQFLLGRLAEAAQDFVHDTVNTNDEAIFWLAAARAESGDVAGAAAELKRTGRIVRPYPRPLRARMGTLVTRAAVDVGDVKQARHIMEIVRLGNLTPQEKTALDLQEGRILELTGDFDGAIAKWEEVRDGYHRLSAIRAIVDRMELLLKLGRIDRREAISDLETVRFAWRGDAFEFKMLRRLGGLYLEEGLYREGLDRLRQAATYYRTHPEAAEVTQQMSDAFARLYLEAEADRLAPVTAIALYDEFKELTPAGGRGDEMIRMLADRLVGVDLLDRAISLLGSQVRFRLQGQEKARVGTQLALIHILGREYATALQVLAETEIPGIGEPLATQRRHLRAKAILSQGDREQALAVLDGDGTFDAELLRTEAFWTARDWRNASQSLRRLIRESGAQPGQQLSEENAAHILNYAITLTLSGNERGLELLNADYAGVMAETPLRDAFNLLTAPPSVGLLDPKDVANRVKTVENFQAFMSAYRERLKTQNLSQVVPAAMVPSIGGRGAAPDADAPATPETGAPGQAPGGAPAEPAAAPPRPQV